MTASSPSSVSGAAPDSTLKRYRIFVDEDRLIGAERDPDGKYVLYDDVAKLLAASSSPSAASPEAASVDVAALRQCAADLERVDWRGGANGVSLIEDAADELERLRPAPPIPSREDARDAATCDCATLRERLAELRAELREIAALFGIEPCDEDRPHSWTDGVTGNTSLIVMLRRMAKYSSADARDAARIDTPSDDAIRAALDVLEWAKCRAARGSDYMQAADLRAGQFRLERLVPAAVSHPEAQTNGN